MEHHRYRLRPRKTRSGDLGTWYYRKRIPEDVKDIWRLSEYNVNLQTKDKRIAEERARGEHHTFLEILAFKRQEKRVTKSSSRERLDEHFRYEAYLRREGAHPEQAPRCWDTEAVAKYQANVERVKYGSFITYEETTSPQPVIVDGKIVADPNFVPETYTVQEFDGSGLWDLLHEFPPDSEQYQETLKDIEFLEGKRSRRYAFRPDIPTLENAKEAYIKFINNKVTAEAKKQSQVRRITRLVNDFATLLGEGRASDGLATSLEVISKTDADRFIPLLRRTKNYNSVEREISMMCAMWNRAVKDYESTWPLDRRVPNAFADKGKHLKDLHDREVKEGLVPDKTRRAFLKYELEALMFDRIPKMREDLQVITKLASYLGCRLEDVTGLVLKDLRLQITNEQPIPSVFLRDNRLRNVTKDGLERCVPLDVNSDVYQSLVKFTSGRKGPEEPVFPRYGLEAGNGAGNASAALNRHIHAIRAGNVRLTFHSLRHTVQAKAMAADINNKWAAYLGGWTNADALGLQREYQKSGVPLPLFLDNIIKIHAVTDWGRHVEVDTSEWD